MNSRTHIVDNNCNRDATNLSTQNVADSYDGMSDGEALLGSVFESCDINNDGKVRVSRLVEYLLKEAAADDNKEILGYLDDLSLILDPAGKDIFIDSEAYQQGVHQWIQNIQSRSSFQDECDKLEDSKLEEKNRKVNGVQVVYRGRGQSNLNMQEDSKGYNDSLGMEGSFAFRSDSSNEWEKSETQILGRIEALQVTNKKLVEDKTKLQAMVENAEEANSSLTTEIDGMKKKLKKYEQLLEKSKAEEREFEALRTTVNEYQSTRDELISRASQLEKENQALQRTIDEYQKSDISRISIQQTLEDENRELLQNLNEQKQLYAELEVLQDLKQKMVDESSSKSEHMTSFIAELSMANEALKAEKNRLEVDLLESKHEISKLTAMTSPSHGLPRQPIHASTPFQKMAPASLQQEINAELISSNMSGSPKTHSGLQNVYDSTESKNGTNDTGESDTSIATASSADKYSTVAQQIAMNFKKKRDMALKHIADLVDMELNSESSQPNKTETKNWAEGLESFADKVQELAVSKQVADKRSGTILEALKKVAVENQVLTESRNKALQKISDISNSSGEMEQRVAQLMEDITNGKTAIEELRLANGNLIKELTKEQDQNLLLQKEIERLKQLELSKPSEASQTGEIGSEQQVKELKQLVHDLETRLHDYTRKLFDLEELVERKDAVCEKQSKELLRLELSNSTSSNKHNEDLRKVLELFSSGGYMAETEGAQPLSFNIVKEKFYEYVTKMQAKLQSMGVRDGPVGSEGNDATNSSYREATHELHRHVDIQATVDNGSCDCETQTASVSCVSVCCGTDLEMVEVETALNAVALLREIQEDRPIPSNLSSGSDEDYAAGIPIIDQSIHGSGSTGAENDLNKKDNERALQLQRSTYDDLKHNELEECLGTCDAVASRPGDAQDSRELNGKDAVEPSGISSNLDGNENAVFSKDVNSAKHDLSSLGRHKRSAKTAERKPKNFSRNKKKTPKFSTSSRKLLIRTESVSTDESISFDEDAMESSDDNRDFDVAKDAESTTESETSVASNSSKRARRIGISAEPVRLPTWTELRESFKLNQQILLEEEINSLESRKESFDNEDVDSPEIGQVSPKPRSIVGHRDSIDVATDRSLVANGIGVTDESMEWFDEFLRTSQEDGVEIPVPTKKRSVSFHFPQDEEMEPIAENSEDILPGPHQPLIKDTSTPNTSPAPHLLGDSVENVMQSEIPSELRADIVAEAGENESVSSSCSAKKEPSPKARPVENQEVQSIRKLTESDKHLEKKFNNAVLAFRTDQYTLERRLENQERARDVAETGMEREIRKLIDSIKVTEKCTVTLEHKESVGQLYSHADVLRKAGMKVSAQAEQHGCFQQEFKTAKMIEVLINYAEHLRLCIERANEVEDIRNKEMRSPGDSRDSTNLEESELAARRMKYAFCEKCNGPLTLSEPGPQVENGFIKEENVKEKAKDCLGFQALASSLIRERRKQTDKESLEEVTEKQFEFDEGIIIADKKTVNYAANLEMDIPDSITFKEPRRSRCSCLATILRFFLSVAILSAILFVFANYVEVDLTLLSRNWNDKLTMYGKTFFNRGKKSAI